MRRILRKIASNQQEHLGDISTLSNPSIIKLLIDNHRNLINQTKEQKNEIP